MTTAELNSRLRKYRCALVLAAEKVIRDARANGMALPRKTQFSHLVASCGEASCAEEIENFLRYQAGRKGQDRGWEPAFVKKVIDALRAETEELRCDDAAMAQAWRLYAVYLMRTHTYEEATSVAPDPSHRERRRGDQDAR